MGDRKYPSIMELAIKAGKWSFIAGSSAAIIGATGCEEEEFPAGDQTMDVHMLDVIEDEGHSEPDYLGVAVDLPIPDAGKDVVEPEDQGGYGNDEWTAGVAPDVYWEPDSKVDAVEPADAVTDAIPVDVMDGDPGLLGDWAGDVYPPSDVVDPDAVLPTDGVSAADVVSSDATTAEVTDDDSFLSGGVPMEDL